VSLLGLALLSSKHLCVFGLYGACIFLKMLHSFGKRSLVGLAVDLVNQPLSFSAVTLLVESANT